MDVQKARQEMVDQQLRQRGLSDERVLAVVSEVPRERFVPDSMQASAYDDRALPIQCGQTISQPYIVALMTTMLDVRDEHRVLEVGTGSGYQTMILARLARKVYTMERIAELQEEARRVLASLGVGNVVFIVGDGTLGHPPAAPYDRILVTAGAPEVPTALVDQLTEGGILVLPVGPTDRQTLTAVEKRGGRVIETPGIGVRFVKLIGTCGWHADEEAAM
ncbi:MAG: protein-L-isoaspartate(D-aspartate) O-methyltransferase [Phycisphaerales bacterium]|nr:MAG: protein-L-isoaspartate(D-aspartate) O-methyltransferase [Phycisphaerales bacterium]